MSLNSPLMRRVTALGLLATPMIVALGAFAIWAVGYWSEASQRITAAQNRIRAAEARMIQVSGYGLLGDAWREFAREDGSGLVREADADAAREIVLKRAADAFAGAGGGLQSATLLDSLVEPGLEHMRFEAHGAVEADKLPLFLTALERGSPRLFLDLLDLQADAAGGRLDVALRASAFRLTDKEGRQ